MRRLVLLVVAAAFAVVPLFAGGQSEAGSVDQPTEVRVFTRWSGAEAMAPLVESAIETLNQSQSAYVYVNASINEQEAYMSRWRTDLATGNLPAIFQDRGINENVGLAESGLLSELSDLFAEEEMARGYGPAQLSGVVFDDFGYEGIYGVPITNAVEVFFYNRRIFEEAGVSVPETYGEFLETIEGLREYGVTPWGVGGSDTWRIVHVWNGLFYKFNGVDGAIALAEREMSYTDPEVVRVLDEMVRLEEMGAFAEDFIGNSYDIEKARFFNGESAMVFNGSWLIGEVLASPIAEDVGIFVMPPMEEHPEWAGHGVAYSNEIMVSGLLDAVEREGALEFVRLFASQEYQTRLAELGNIPVRSDVDLSAVETSSLFNEAVEDTRVWTRTGPDVHAFDTVTEIGARIGSLLSGLFLGESSENVAARIAEIIADNE